MVLDVNIDVDIERYWFFLEIAIECYIITLKMDTLKCSLLNIEFGIGSKCINFIFYAFIFF